MTDLRTETRKKKGKKEKKEFMKGRWLAALKKDLLDNVPHGKKQLTLGRLSDEEEAVGGKSNRNARRPQVVRVIPCKKIGEENGRPEKAVLQTA